MKCEDCDIEINYDSKHAAEHSNQCCDCFDELVWGMPEYQRTVLTEKSTDETKKKHAAYWAKVAERKKKKRDKLN